MHALTVTRVRKFLAEEMAADAAGVDRWVRHWQSVGFAALEAALADRPSDWPFCFGDQPGWADLHLVPQLGAARRLGCHVSPYKRLLAVEANCVVLDAFRQARPEAQPDCPGDAT